MHLSLIVLAIAIACGVRLWARSGLDQSRRWQHTLGLFLLPPLLLLITAIAVLRMGKQGQMLGLPVGEIGYTCALCFLGIAGILLLWRSVLGWRSLRQISHYPMVAVEQTGAHLAESTQAHLLEIDLPFAAQVGFWQPRLVISQGLLSQLSPAQIAAVLVHEQAHLYYRDTFWFFWLGWLRQLTIWLPNTEYLWQELLLLRELRADRWAAQRVDSLSVAEALLCLSRAPLANLENLNWQNSCAAVSADAAITRLEERIEALLSKTEPSFELATLSWTWLLLALLPLLTIVLHH
jgi:Zn-dependent protease with chaperone function